jgi:hypothetical protein
VKLENFGVKHGQVLLKPRVIEKGALKDLEPRKNITNLGVCLHNDFKGLDAVGSHLPFSIDCA